MQVGAVSLGWAGKALTVVLDELASMGGQCLELNSKPGLHDGLVLDRHSASQVQAWAAAAGVEISGLSGYNDFAQDTRETLAREVEGLLSTCRLAAELGVGIVRAFPGELKPGLSLETAWPALIEGFEQACRLAEPLGVVVAIENHGLLLTDGPALARLVHDVGAPNLGLTLDTGNFCWAGHDARQAQVDFQAVLPHVVNVHVKDGVWHEGQFLFVPAGKGELPLAEWLAQLARRGYRGPICSEFEGSGDFVEGTRESVGYLLELAASTTSRAT